MNTRERFVRTLTGQEVDRVPFIKVFGGDNAVLPRWEEECPGIGGRIDELLQFEGGYRGWRITPVNFDLSRRGDVEINRTDSGDEIHRWADGTAVLMRTGGDFHAHIVESPVRNREDWERVKTRHLDPDDPTRYPDNWDDCVREYATRDYPLQLTHRGVYGMVRNLVGDENLAYLFYDDPELVHDMMDYYTDMFLKMAERLCADVQFDLIEFWEDMASKNGSIISPTTFREFMRPNYLKCAGFAKRHNIPILLVDSDGYIEKLAELMLECGVNAMYPFEVLAGNDTGKTLDKHPGLGAIGGLDKNAMALGKDAMDAEIEKARTLIRKGRFIPGPDHFALTNVPFANYRYFMEHLREAVLATRPGG